jgi:hypothetical protein
VDLRACEILGSHGGKSEDTEPYSLEVDKRFKCIQPCQVIALMVEAVCTCETWVYFNETTRHYIPEGSHFKTLDFFEVWRIL